MNDLREAGAALAQQIEHHLSQWLEKAVPCCMHDYVKASFEISQQLRSLQSFQSANAMLLRYKSCCISLCDYIIIESAFHFNFIESHLGAAAISSALHQAELSVPVLGTLKVQRQRKLLFLQLSLRFTCLL